MEKIRDIFRDAFKIIQEGENSESDSSFKELADSIKGCMKSENEKYSIENYLDVVSKYTDQIILSSEKNYLAYLGGECKITRDSDNESLKFTLEMYFEGGLNKKIKKTATRKIPLEKFTDEAIQKLGEKEMIFEILKPEET